MGTVVSMLRDMRLPNPNLYKIVARKLQSPDRLQPATPTQTNWYGAAGFHLTFDRIYTPYMHLYMMI